MKSKWLPITGLIFAVVVFLFLLSAFTVDETEQVVITRFGKVIGETISEPGLYFKYPIVDMVNKFPSNLREWDGEKGELPTLKKKYIWVDTFARWRINNPILFFQTIISVENASDIMADIIDTAVKNVIANTEIIEAVRNSDRKMDSRTDIKETKSVQANEDRERHVKIGRTEITSRIFNQAKPKLAEFGIELVDVKIKRINYREDVRASVYDRMIAERVQIVEKFRSEGRGEAQKILGEKEKKLKQITSEAYKTAQILMGDADATATKIFADAYSRDPDFYSFVKTLDVYSKSLDGNSSLILSTDSELLKYMKDLK
jgi:modulator of FtsH protease HflC